MLMTTAENQAMADLRLPVLLQIPGVLHSVSVEPGLGMVDFCRPFAKYLRELDWVICGGETGPHARPMHPDWVRSLRDQCQATAVPFFFKSWGEWLPLNQGKTPITENYHGAKTKKNWYWHPGSPSEASIRVGKCKAGRTLDGRTWEETPNV
jgi:protein gp37